jgi:hypothetical protein
VNYLEKKCLGRKFPDKQEEILFLRGKFIQIGNFHG